MAYSLELYFTGLCAFVPDEANKQCDLLLVRADDPENIQPPFEEANKPNPHRPMLVLPSSGLHEDNEREPDFLVPDGNGSTMACFYLENEDLQLEVKGRAPDFRLQTGPHNDSFDHVIPLLDVFAASGVTALKPSVLTAGNFNDVVTRCHFEHGTLKTHRFAQRDGFPLEFDFHPYSVSTTTSDPTRRKIADFCVLEIEGLTTVAELQSTPGKLPIKIFTPNSQPVKGFLTNYDQTLKCPGKMVLDFLWYYRLADFGAVAAASHENRVIPGDSGEYAAVFSPEACACPPCVIKPKGTAAPAVAATTAASFAVPVPPPVQIVGAKLGLTSRQVRRLEDHLGTDALGLLAERVMLLLGGAPANGSYPECVGIRRGKAAIFCSGVLLDERHVLTARHSLSPKETYIINDDTQTRKATIKDRHPVADLAILKLSQPLLITPPTRGAVNVADLVTLVGWGNTSAPPSSGNKTFGTMTVTTLDIGTTAPHSGLSLGEMQAAPTPQSAAPVDSGGPVFVQPNGINSRVLVAIIRGPATPGAIKEADSILVRLEPFEGWIQSVLSAP
ncbi:MAG: S1 family peptidase [Thermoanaerobaculia bacterium]|nr:S1 family peptidase [Thermoanaerobaculia bacterium]